MMYDYLNLWLGKLICGLVLIKYMYSEVFRGNEQWRPLPWSYQPVYAEYLAGLSFLRVLAWNHFSILCFITESNEPVRRNPFNMISIDPQCDLMQLEFYFI